VDDSEPPLDEATAHIARFTVGGRRQSDSVHREKTREKPPRRNKAMENLVKEGKFADAILLGWGTTEFLMDDVLLREYGLSGYDHRAEPLLNLDFEVKLQLQYKSGMLSREEFKTVKQFQEKRNRAFHKEGVSFLHSPQAELAELAELAIGTVQVMLAIGQRSLQPTLNGVHWVNVQSSKENTKLRKDR
jgi:hypothetical protein